MNKLALVSSTIYGNFTWLGSKIELEHNFTDTLSQLHASSYMISHTTFLLNFKITNAVGSV